MFAEDVGDGLRRLRPPPRARSGLMMPAFSCAMASRLPPSRSTWSQPMLVITLTSGVTTLVLSKRPPRPVSITAMSTCAPPGTTGRPRPRSIRRTKAGSVEAVAVEFHEARHRVLWDHGAIDADALAEVLQVRRGVQARPVSGLLQHAGQHVTGAALAVGARDVHAFQSVAPDGRACASARACCPGPPCTPPCRCARYIGSCA